MNEGLQTVMGSTLVLGALWVAYRVELWDKLRVQTDVAFSVGLTFIAGVNTLLAVENVQVLWQVALLFSSGVGFAYLCAHWLQPETARPALMGALALSALGLSVMEVQDAIAGPEWGVVALLVAILGYRGVVRPRGTPTPQQVVTVEGRTYVRVPSTTTTDPDLLASVLSGLFLLTGSVLGFMHLRLGLSGEMQRVTATQGSEQLVVFACYYLGLLAAYAWLKLEARVQVP